MPSNSGRRLQRELYLRTLLRRWLISYLRATKKQELILIFLLSWPLLPTWRILLTPISVQEEEEEAEEEVTVEEAAGEETEMEEAEEVVAEGVEEETEEEIEEDIEEEIEEEAEEEAEEAEAEAVTKKSYEEVSVKGIPFHF